MSGQELESIESLKDEINKLKNTISKLEARVAMSNSAFLNIVGNSSDGIIILDKNKMVLFSNHSAIQLINRNLADLLGNPFELDISGISPEINITHDDGSISVAEVKVIDTEWNNMESYLVSLHDITERKKSEEMLTYMTHHDYLTNLPNRVHFEEKLSNAIQQAKNNNGHMALLYFDIDGFKEINDKYGHDVGDQFLKEVSALLKLQIRQNDTVARLGGDEFALIVCSLSKIEFAEVIAENILQVIKNYRFILNEKELFTTASIGIAVYPFSGNSSIDLLKKADAAMYEAKKNGKNQYQYAAGY